MITDKIKALFQYIDFLHSNIDNFKQYEGTIQELHELDVQRNELQPEKNFIQKKKFDEIQQLFSEKFDLIREGVVLPVKNKAIELNVCDFSKEPIYSWYGVESDIRKLKESFSENDLNEIFTAKNKYIEFRKKTVSSMKFTGFFVGELDEVSKLIFDFFKETEINEFESFEAKTIHVESIEEAARILTNKIPKKDLSEIEVHENDFEAQNQTMFAISKKKAKFRLKNGQVQHHYHTTKGTFDLENDNVYDIETGKIVQVGTRTDYNSSFMIDLANLYVLDVKDYLQHHYNHSINKNQYLDYVRYAVPNTSIIKSEGIKQAARDWLERLNIQEGSVKQESANRQKDFGLSDLITHENSFEIVKAIKVQYKNIGGKRLKLLLMALQELNLLPKDRVAKKFHECCKKEFDWEIKSYNAMNGCEYNEITDFNEKEAMKNFIQEYIQ